jgi:ribonuclease
MQKIPGMLKILGLVFSLLLAYHASTLHSQKNTTEPVTKYLASKSENRISTLSETVTYIKEKGTLPEYYITKEEAAVRGWKPAKGNLCDVLPGRVIGGSIFTNAQRLLPLARGRIWYEADFDYSCGGRNAKRILYSSDGLVYITTDHYKTVTPAS